MGRPATAVGTFGKIRHYEDASGYRARTLYRDHDGISREVERRGETKGAAERALKAALRDRGRVTGAIDEDITPASMMSTVAESWWAGFSVLERSPGTKRNYRDRIDQQILPAVGNLRAREMTVGAAERFLRAVETRYGSSVAKMTKTVLSNICGFATRRDAMPRNPVRDTSSISVKPRAKPKALSLEAARQLRMLLTYDEKARRRDIVDLVDVMLATGVRIGEALALIWDAVDLEVRTVEIRGTVIRIKGSGLIIKPEPKTEAGFRTLILPKWCVARLAERRERLDCEGLRSASAAGGFAGGLVFPSSVGTLRDPTNIDDMLKDAFEFAGEDMTSHKLRKTAATILDGAKLSARQIADQLGHATPSLTQDVYMGRGELSPAAAEALEALG